MQIDVSKSARQEKGAGQWQHSDKFGSKAPGIGTMWYPTGMGKTFTALNYIVNPLLDKRPTSIVIILVHRDELKKQWKDRIGKFVHRRHRSQIVVQTVQYYIKHQTRTKCDLLIVDEVHKFYGADYFTYVNGDNIGWKYLLCLTATYTDKDGRHKQLEDIGCHVTDHITEQEALDNGWISKYIEYNLAVKMTNEEVIRYKEICEFVDNNLSKFGKHSFDGANKCLNGKTIEKDGIVKEYTGFDYCLMWANANGWRKPKFDEVLTEEQISINAMWNPNVIMGYAKNSFKGIRERVKFTNECLSKMNTVIDIIEKFKEYKIMSFSESTTFANRLSKKLNTKNPDSCVVFHSQLNSRPLKDDKGKYILYGKTAKKAGEVKLFGLKTLKKVYIEKFVNNEVRVLSTAKVLDEGFDCEDIQVAIISSRSRNYNQQKQRKGRAIRVLPEAPDDYVLIINPFLEGTKDQEALVAAQSKSTNNITWVHSIDQIDFDPNSRNSFNDI